ncbi:hypothetical protein E0Z10_g10724 [Xylaria hypoxylon]|uniref:Clr5 domain-containing protein n=1 Tax=Xylaria hypoxylon TaxID=37992 RepID=A0A4Z0Y3V6_9PEZI|nr:hypothetical protein E0Z10_g10724 [Xylaria hypoxylon]
MHQPSFTRTSSRSGSGRNTFLPAKQADFMVKKAEKRKREGKKTVFSYGGNVWTSNQAERSLSRSKKARYSEDLMDVDTPSVGISYKTPKAISPSPSEALVISPGPDVADSEPQDLNSEQPPAAEYEDNEDTESLDSVDNRSPVEVYGTVSGGKADQTIESLSRELVKKLGYSHKRTQQHVLHVVELLNSWHREEDAMGLFAHSKELLEQGRAIHRPCHRASARPQNPNRRQGKGKEPVPPAVESDGKLSIEGILDMVNRDDSPAKDEEAEGLLVKIIELCEISPKDRDTQHLNARAELLRLYQKLGTIDDNMSEYTKSEGVFNTIWKNYDWDREKFSSLEVMEAGMQLALEMFKAAFEDEASNMFNQVSDMANTIFHPDDERTIWILISIGLAYQAHGTWADAERWFEHALANALSVWKNDDGIVKSLQKGVDEKHFSYLSDEGRPSKTIFGISGVKIMPGRLHMC